VKSTIFILISISVPIVGKGVGVGQGVGVDVVGNAVTTQPRHADTNVAPAVAQVVLIVGAEDVQEADVVLK